MRKREQWEATWALQRHEDRIDAEVEAEAPGWREELQSQAVKRFGSATSPDALAWVEDQLAQEIARQKVERKEMKHDRKVEHKEMKRDQKAEHKERKDHGDRGDHGDSDRGDHGRGR